MVFRFLLKSPVVTVTTTAAARRVTAVSSTTLRPALASFRALSTDIVPGASATPIESDATPSMPSAFDSIVKLVFVDPNGARRQVPGLVGKTLHEVCTMNGIEIGPACTGGLPLAERSERWTEPVFGEGPTTGFDHVVLEGPGSKNLPVFTSKEESLLSEYWDDDEIWESSRLACMIPITKEMDGMIVYVPERKPYDCD